MKFTKVGPKKSTLLYAVVMLYTVVVLYAVEHRKILKLAEDGYSLIR